MPAAYATRELTFVNRRPPLSAAAYSATRAPADATEAFQP
jgi:hypothetical protein